MRNSSSTYDKVSRRMLTDPRISRLINLVAGALRPPSGVGRIALALALGVLCHSLFAAAVLAMMAPRLKLKTPWCKTSWCDWRSRAKAHG